MIDEIKSENPIHGESNQFDRYGGGLVVLNLDNFLLPGNMEDGTDKSRHWNVFGGIALYKSPEDSLILSFEREIMDVRDEDHSVEAVREFIRDTIANINGIYYVVSMNPDLICMGATSAVP